MALEFKQIFNHSFLLKNRHDSFVAKRLLKKIKLRRCKILADKGYPNYDFIEMSKTKQNNFISPPKNYGGKCKHNNFKRERKIRNFESNKKIYIFLFSFLGFKLLRTMSFLK